MLSMRMKSFLLFIMVGLLSVMTACSSTVNSSESVSDASAEDTSNMPEEVKLAYQISPNAELLAKGASLLEEKLPGVKVTWLQFDSGRDINAAIASGDIDFGLMGSPAAAAGMAQGLPYVAYAVPNIIGENEALYVREEITSLADLKGKKIAVPFGSTSHYSLLSYLNAESIDLSTFTLLDMLPQDILAAWQRGDIDGAYVWNPTLEKLTQTPGHKLISSAQLAEQGIVTADVSLVRTEFVDQYPEVVQAFVESMDEAVMLYRDDLDEAVKVMVDQLGLSEEESLKAMNGLLWLDTSEQIEQYMGADGEIGTLPEILWDSAKFLQDQKVIGSVPELAEFEKLVRNEFVNAE